MVKGREGQGKGGEGKGGEAKEGRGGKGKEGREGREGGRGWGEPPPKTNPGYGLVSQCVYWKLERRPTGDCKEWYKATLSRYHLLPPSECEIHDDQRRWTNAVHYRLGEVRRHQRGRSSPTAKCGASTGFDTVTLIHFSLSTFLLLGLYQKIISGLIAYVIKRHHSVDQLSDLSLP
jgi:hypothetical protein